MNNDQRGKKRQRRRAVPVKMMESRVRERLNANSKWRSDKKIALIIRNLARLLSFAAPNKSAVSD